MNVKVNDLMASSVVTTFGHKSIGHVKKIMKDQKIHSIPIVNSEQEPVGIVTAKDLIRRKSDETPVSMVMTKGVKTVPQYADVYIAARMMRNNHIHHLVVTHEKKISGIISSFDLLRLVEDRRFVYKNPPTPSRKNNGRT